jgi:Fe-S cluster assembly protein SufA
MTVKTFDSTDTSNPVRVTPAAAEHFRKQLAARGFAGIRFSLSKSGCTGYKYVIDEVREPEQGDIATTLDNGVVLYISAADIPALRGMELDYVLEGVNRKLVINNPNTREACGCGESFSF